MQAGKSRVPRSLVVAQAVFFTLLGLSIAAKAAKLWFQPDQEVTIEYLSPPPSDLRDTQPGPGVVPTIPRPPVETAEAWAARAVELPAPRPAAGEPAPATRVGLVQLSSPSRPFGAAPGRVVRFVDYRFLAEKPGALGVRWFLVVRSPAGVSEWDWFNLPLSEQKYAGRLAFALPAGTDPAGGVEVSVERDGGADAPRVRISNVLALP